MQSTGDRRSVGALDLPLDVWAHIVLRLSNVREIVYLLRTARYFRALRDDPLLWRTLLQRYGLGDSDTVSLDDMSARQLYRCFCSQIDVMVDRRWGFGHSRSRIGSMRVVLDSIGKPPAVHMVWGPGDKMCARAFRSLKPLVGRHRRFAWHVDLMPPSDRARGLFGRLTAPGRWIACFFGVCTAGMRIRDSSLGSVPDEMRGIDVIIQHNGSGSSLGSVSRTPLFVHSDLGILQRRDHGLRVTLSYDVDHRRLSFLDRDGNVALRVDCSTLSPTVHYCVGMSASRLLIGQPMTFRVLPASLDVFSAPVSMSVRDV